MGLKRALDGCEEKAERWVTQPSLQDLQRWSGDVRTLSRTGRTNRNRIYVKPGSKSIPDLALITRPRRWAMDRWQFLQSGQSLHRLRRQHALFAATEYVLHVTRSIPGTAAPAGFPVLRPGRHGGIAEILQDLTLDTLDVPRPPLAANSKSIYYTSRFWWT
jgi:hypothetical protein